MTSRSPPVIEFPKTLSTTSSATGDRVIDALENYGCFMATYDNLKGCHETLEKKLPELFKASKEKFVHLDKITSDYFAYTSNRQYESFGIPKATTDEGIKKFITSIWPEGNEAVRRAIKGYTTTAAELEEMVRKMAPEQYTLPKESTGYIFHMMKYKKEAILDFPNHEDKFLALLDLHQANGLKMTTTDEKYFSIDVKPSTFLIMAGKPLKDWKEVKIHGKHGNGEEYSVGLFSYRKQVGSSSGS